MAIRKTAIVMRPNQADADEGAVLGLTMCRSVAKARKAGDAYRAGDSINTMLVYEVCALSGRAKFYYTYPDGTDRIEHKEYFDTYVDAAIAALMHMLRQDIIQEN